MHRTLKSCGAALLAVVTAFAAEPSLADMTLLQALQAAREHDPAFSAARAQSQAGATRERQARALFLPQVHVSGSAGVVSSDQDTRGANFSAPGFGASNDTAFRTRIEAGPTTSLSLVAQQPLYNLERRAGARQLERQAQIAALELKSAEQALMLRTAQTYFAVVVAEEALATLRAHKQAAGRALDEAKERFEAGATPVTDRHEAQSRFDTIRTREILAENELEMKRIAFAHLTGKRPAVLHRVGSAAPMERFDHGTLDDWLELAQRENALIAIREATGEIAQDEIDKYRGRASPVVDLYARVADERMQGSSGYGATTHVTTGTRAVGVQIAIPFYTGGMRDAKRDEAAALAEKARSDVNAARQEVLRQTQTAWLAAATGLARLQAQEQALRSAELRLDATQTGREVGARTTLDYMNALAEYYTAQHNLTEAKYQLLLDRLRLAANAGVLSEARVGDIDLLLSRRP
ncbi:MAG: TolC family outer membrane protein [Burkholderiales bacterium]